MEVKEIDYAKLNEAVEKFGSLQKVNAQLEKDKLALEKKNVKLKQENEKLMANRNNLVGQVDDLNTKVKNYQDQLQSLANKINIYSHQYELFCGFMIMVTESPSVTDSIDTIIASFQKLKKPGWYLPKNADEMRSLFVRTVMGDYLKCFRCDTCSARFIVNKKPKDKLFGSGYYCPVCHNWYSVKEDDSFLKALVSKKQLEDTQHLEDVLKEIEVLEPFKAFLIEPCEICHKTIEKWDDYSVKLAIQGIGCGHTSCWKSELGRLLELRKAIEKVKKDIK
jgi:FtsZ-binding cell division protein ZapB